MNIRQSEIVRSLSEAVNSMIDTVGSGRFGFDYAVREYTQQAHGELALAFEDYLQAMGIGGVPLGAMPNSESVRRAALLALANRVNVPEVTAFAQAMIEAQDTHSNLLDALKSQAEQLKSA